MADTTDTGPNTVATSNTTTPTSAAPTQQVITVHLQKIPLLTGLDNATLSLVASSMQFRTIARGKYVLHKGSPGDHLLFLLSGRLQAVDLTEDGREIGLSFLTPGDYFGELSIIDNQPRSASVIACENSLIALLPRAQSLALIYHHPLVAERLLKRMAASIRTASNYQTILSMPNAFQRVFALLKQLVTQGPGDLMIIEKMPTQQEVAIMVNTSRETVSRAIQNLIQKGIVEKDLRRLIVRQPEALENAANGENLPTT